MMQKVLLAVLIASRKMRHYFESDPVTMVCGDPGVAVRNSLIILNTTIP